VVFLAGPNVQATPDAIITVNSIADNNSRDDVVTLREAILLATGGLDVGDLDGGECAQVSESTYGPACGRTGSIGAASADSILFDSAIFPSDNPATIALAADLPWLNTGNDAVDGNGAGVMVSGASECIRVGSSDNSVRAIRVSGCGTGIYVESLSAENAGGNHIVGVTATESSVGILIASGPGNEVIGSFVGTDAAGRTGLGNTTGIKLETTGANRIGGPEASDRNIISGNGAGISVSSGGHVIENNFIGTDVSGLYALPNTGDGIRAGVETAWHLSIIGNVISGNGAHGIEVQDSGGHTIIGNLIGTNASGTAALGNGGDGIYLYSGSHVVIGGAVASDRNVISGNAQNGIETWGSGCGLGRNAIKGNLIGVDIGGATILGNGLDGIRVVDAGCDTIGGPGPGEGNIVAGNGANGVQISGFDAEGNTVRGNSIFSNSLKGIDTVAGGNHELAPPIVDSASGSVSGHTSPKCYPCTVDVYSDTEDEGRVYHGSKATIDDATGTWDYAGPVSGPNITVTVTDAGGNTSEFSAPMASPPPDIDGDGIPDSVDSCPNEPEDFDGFQDSDGCPEPCPGGDVNGDGRVDSRDVRLVARALGSSPGQRRWNPVADLNHNGRVDLQDLLIVVRSSLDRTCRPRR
jgi:parallel beta-helix repeat protein